MPENLVNPNDSLERQNAKLIQIASALMRRVEQDTDRTGAAYAQFERAALLEDQVSQRTRDLEHVLDLLNTSNAALAEARHAAETAHANMSNAIEAVQEGFALFDAQDALVMRNSRFGMHMPDVQPDVQPGLTFSQYVAFVSESRFLLREQGETCRDWARKRMRLHDEPHVMFNVHLISDRWLQVSEHRTPDGGTVVLQTDVTDIMRLERLERGKLKDTQARMLRATLDHLNQGVCIFDKDTLLVGWNIRIRALLSLPASLLRIGMGFDRLMDHLISDLDTSTDQAEAFRAWAHQDAPRPALRFEVFRRPNLTMDVFAREMPDRGFVISFTDVSTEREAARALGEANERLERRVHERTLELEDALADAERANTSKSRFVAAASHDLVQPLSAAKLYLASLRDADAKVAQTAEKALNALGSAESIIEALLDISKLDAGRASMDVTNVSLGRILSGLRDEFEPTALMKGIDLRVISTNLQVTSDPGFLRRILQNLIGNAIRYTQTGRVLVGVRRRGGSARIEVWDTGPGIAEADQERIFNEFERLSASAINSEGLGLGLAIVERACAQLGHPLGMTSVVGQGTRFFVSLDRAEGPLATASAVRSKLGPIPMKSQGLVVLLVENDNNLRPALAQLFESWGVDAIEASSYDEALHLLDEIQLLPDAAVLDYQLGPGPSGLDLAQKLNDLSDDIDTCIFSADRSETLLKNCTALNLPLLSKPLDTDALKAFFARVADRKAKLRRAV